MTKKISVCIATYNGAAKIIKTLKAIVQNTVLPNEIIVFIDGSTDKTLAEISRFGYEDLIKVYSSTNMGRATARNQAASYAQNELLLFLDDDILIPEQTIERHLHFHEENSKAVLTCPTLTILSRNDFSNFKRNLEEKWNKHAGISTEVTFAAAFFSIGKSTFFQLGGFHDGLMDAEDYELGIRMATSGVPVMVENNLIGIHNDPISCYSFIKRNRQYLKANQMLAEQQLVRDNKYVPEPPGKIKKLIFRLLTRRFLVRLIDQNSFKWLYKPIRFKMYDYISAGFIYYFPDKPIEK